MPAKNYKTNVLHINPEHIDIIRNLPWMHRDLFDIVIMEQVTTEDMIFVIKDSVMSQNKEVKPL